MSYILIGPSPKIVEIMKTPPIVEDCIE